MAYTHLGKIGLTRGNSMFSSFGKLLIGLGIFLIIIGCFMIVMPKFGLGKLPGDIL